MNKTKVGFDLGRLIPDRIFADIYEITPDYLISIGIKALVLDIDNTLVTYDDPEPTPSVLRWFKAMNEKGIQISFVSNNHAERVELFNKNLGYFAKADAKKPFGKYIREAMRYMGTTPENTLFIGDQIFTDIFAGKCQGLRAFLVPPIKDKTTLFFRTKRFLEIPLVNHYYRKHRGENRVR